MTIWWVPDEERAAMDRELLAECQARGENGAIDEIRVMGPWRKRRHRIRMGRLRWWQHTPLNVPMWRATRRLERTMRARGIDPKHPRALIQLWGQYDLTRDKD